MLLIVLAALCASLAVLGGVAFAASPGTQGQPNQSRLWSWRPVAVPAHFFGTNSSSFPDLSRGVD
jgi:hypothetical protein